MYRGRRSKECPKEGKRVIKAKAEQLRFKAAELMAKAYYLDGEQLFTN
jgi:hypothetical protein